MIFAPRVIPVDSTGRRGVVYRIWYWNPHGKSCLMNGCYGTREAAERKMEVLKKEGRV